MAGEFRFTEHAVRGAEVPARGRANYRDTKTPYLRLRVTTLGKRSFYYVRRIDGKLSWIMLGTWPKLSVQEARELAGLHTSRIAKGDSPGTVRRRGERTLGELFEAWMEGYSRSSKRTWQRDESQWNRTLSHWSGRAASSVTSDDVKALMKRLKRDNARLDADDEFAGNYAANKAYELLSAVFNWSIAEGLFDGPNPCTPIRRFPRRQRERYLAAGELQRFLDALGQLRSETSADFFRLLLFTGQRRDNVATMRWDELDLVQRLWTIPAAKAKGKKPHHVPLTDRAMAVLDRRHAERNGSTWVLPSRSSAGHITDPKAAFRITCERAGIADLRMHDLRHTFASILANAGASIPVIAKALGHRNQQSSQRYVHMETAAVGAVVNAAFSSLPSEGVKG